MDKRKFYELIYHGRDVQKTYLGSDLISAGRWLSNWCDRSVQLVHGEKPLEAPETYALLNALPKSSDRPHNL